MAKYTIGEICEKLDYLGKYENYLREGRSLTEDDYLEIAELLSEYGDILLGIKVDI